ncbi:efflux RND transporter periplasmic adaptor subunit [Candidatus Pelagibacter sp.]|uniref:efflux RND transporter periplasmic adaptor subunit n=1 Tax=Candidatus Pelagibacter sp. TaxID=2024849 RepID=UPI003F84C9FD
MKRKNKIILAVFTFFLIIAIVIIGRTMIGNHFKKKFSKRPPPGIIVTEVTNKQFYESIDTFGTAVSNKTKSFRIKKNELQGELKLNSFIKKGETIVKLNDRNIIAPFDGVLGYTGLTEDILVSDSTIIITLDDNSIIYSDIKIPENYSALIKKDLPIEARVSSYKDKVFNGTIDFVSSRINADTRSLLSRVRIENNELSLMSGSLLEVNVKVNSRDGISIPDTSIIMEGEKSYVYKISKENVAEKTEVKIGARKSGDVEILSGLNVGDIVAAEGLKKIRPMGKIKPINK